MKNRNAYLIPCFAAALSLNATAAEPSIEELSKQLKEQQAQIEALAEALENNKGQYGGGPEWFQRTSFGGYAEHHYNNFSSSDKDDQIDAHRWVLLISHEFNDKVRMFSEFELEHSLSGDGKDGEVELEQAYIEWDYVPGHHLNAGLFLLPVGILNETHEPDTFYGVERNNVEKNIIPTTWWETGLMSHGELGAGFSYNAAITSGLEYGNTTDKVGNIRSARQKSSKATAEDFAYTGRLKYTGVAGLELAATLQYQEDLSQGALDDSASAIMYETHAIYETGPFEIRALYAAWDIDGDDTKTLGNDKQYGYYIEPSYKVLDNLGFFARYSKWDNYDGSKATENREVEQMHIGANFWLTDTVVFKLDVLEEDDAKTNKDNDGFNLGVGWSF